MRNLFTLTLVVFGLNGCNTGINCIRGSGPVATREIELHSTFDQINFEIAGNVTLLDAPEQKIVVEHTKT